MSVDYSALSPQARGVAIKTATLDATAADSTEILCPRWANRVTVTFKTSADADDSGNLAFEGTDGAAIDADNQPVASGGTFGFAVAAYEDMALAFSIFVVASTNSAKCHVIFESESRGG
jgi:hypothetical protein|tara:strand:- start:692 stop:1048 length:357 start_codon:yes stop_codon:yes gene_type:complete